MAVDKTLDELHEDMLEAKVEFEAAQQRYKDVLDAWEAANERETTV